MTSTTVRSTAARVHPAPPSSPLPLMAGIAAGPIFLGVGLVQAFTRPGFDLQRHALSQLALGPGGSVQIANFLLAGALLVVASYGLRRALDPGVGAVWGPRLVAGFGVGMVLAGVFVADPAYAYPPGTADAAGDLSWHGALHSVGFAVAMLSWISACVVLARALHARGARHIAWFCLAALPAVVVLAASPALGGFGVRLVLVCAVQFAMVAAVCSHLARSRHPA